MRRPVARRLDISMEAVDCFLTKMYRGAAADFVYTSRASFVRAAAARSFLRAHRPDHALS